MTSERALHVIQDVQGVVGSFVADAAGELLAQLVPAEIDEASLRRTALRVGRIVRCAELCELDVQRCDFRFDRCQLLVWRFEGGLLGVLVKTSISRRALSMAARLALRELRSPLQIARERESAPDDLAFDDEVTSQYPSAPRSSGDAE